MNKNIIVVILLIVMLVTWFVLVCMKVDYLMGVWHVVFRSVMTSEKSVNLEWCYAYAELTRLKLIEKAILKIINKEKN